MTTAKTAQYWVTSEAPDAVQWRKEADFFAIQEIVLLALADQKQNESPFQIPARELARPPVTITKFFTMPDAVISEQRHEIVSPAAAAALTVIDKGGKFYTIPEGNQS